VSVINIFLTCSVKETTKFISQKFKLFIDLTSENIFSGGAEGCGKTTFGN